LPESFDHHPLCLELEFEEPIHSGILRHRDSAEVVLKTRNPFTRSILQPSTSKSAAALNPHNTPSLAVHPIKEQPNEPASQETLNKANTIKNSVKIDRYLIEIEKVHGFSKSWAFRERLEQGHISFDELQQRWPVAPNFGS
jgi:hypothetical protein